MEIQQTTASLFASSDSLQQQRQLQQQQQRADLPKYYGDPLNLNVSLSESGHEILRPKPRRPNGGSYRELYCPAHTKESTNGSSSKVNATTTAVHMVAEERDTDRSMASTPTSFTSTAYYPHQSQHHHISLRELKALQEKRECAGNSSSDENRSSSGHASMSDGTGGHTSGSSPAQRQQQQSSHSPPLNSVPEDESPAQCQRGQLARGRPAAQTRGRHRPLLSAAKQLQSSGSGLEDAKLAIRQLTLRSHTSSSTYSSLSGGSSGSSSSSSDGRRRPEPGPGSVVGGSPSSASTAPLGRHRGGSSSSRLEETESTASCCVVAADEFAWVEPQNRLVELGQAQLPWSQGDVLRVLEGAAARELGSSGLPAPRLAGDALPRLSYLLQRALVRLAREVQRLARPLGLCGQREVYGGLRVLLCPALADSCAKACLRAAAMFGLSASAGPGPRTKRRCSNQPQLQGPPALQQSKSARSGLQLSVGRFFRWMVDVRLGRMVHEYAAVYLTAAMENLLEEIVLQCLRADKHPQLLSANLLDHAIANSADLWGLLQPYAHLNAGRLASGALAMPRWASASSLNSSNTSSRSCNSNSSGGSNRDAHSTTTGQLEALLLTTCVGSLRELQELLAKLAQSGKCPLPLSNKALGALFYYMRCSQLEQGGSGGGPGTQELAYERAYAVLPPLVEWLRVASAHAEYRQARLVDQDDVNQAARLLLPGVDCPVRPICAASADDDDPTAILDYYGKRRSSRQLGVRSQQDDQPTEEELAAECARRLDVDLAFRLLCSGRAPLIRRALALLPEPKIDTVNERGLTALMLACVNGDENGVIALLEAGASLDVETPAQSQPAALPAIKPASTQAPTANHQAQANSGPLANFYSETQHWTALTYTALLGHCNIARILLERGAAVEGGVKLSEDKCTITPLQAATASGNDEMVALLLAHGAQPFLSTLMKDSFCYSGSAQRGCYSAISVATAHGQRTCLQQLLTHPLNFSAQRGEKEVLSLEEILAEGLHSTPAQQQNTVSIDERGKLPSSPQQQQPDGKNELVFNKIQYKALQEAMYHSVESNYLDITMKLRGLRVSWTLHCWIQSLSTAHELRIESVIDQLLQDFLQVCPDDYSMQFVEECLPLLFNIFRYSKKEGTMLLLADIFCTCYGWEPIKPIRDSTLSSGSRIDPKFVNNPELSDVQFRVEGKVFYGHKIVLVTSSPRFRNMLSSKLCEGNPPIVQINDIRYHIFQLVMEFLYHGGCATLKVNQNDVLELMAAANFFQLDGLLRFCEAQCSSMVNLDNIVFMYIHAKVYNAVQLLEYCQGFLLQNMVALLTYDDSVKRLLFAKKLPNHDVLTGLLSTLQTRIKTKKSQNLK